MSADSPDSSMVPVSWRALTASRFVSLKDYVTNKDYKLPNSPSSQMRSNKKQPWDQWARRRLGRPHTSPEDLQPLGVEKVQLFPGWAVRRYIESAKAGEQGSEFSLDVYVSGFTSSVRPPEAATRSQKVFYRIAKGYAALPKLPTPVLSPQSLLQSSVLSDPPSELAPSTDIVDESELSALEAHLQNVSNPWHASDDESDGYTGTDVCRSEPALPQIVDESVQILHANFDARLQPFWSNAISNRLVKLSLFCPPVRHLPSDAQQFTEGQEIESNPVATQNVITDPQGSFQTTFNVSWERLATHPQALHIAFGESNIEYPVIIQAEMWTSPTQSSPSPAEWFPYAPYQRGSASRSQAQFFPASGSSASSSLSSPQIHSQDSQPTSIKICVTIPLSTHHVPIRLISDIDDTIKYAGVPLGAKHVFRNVFVRPLDELVVHSMVDWYRALWQRGVRFHYVSNSPFELLPVIKDFFHISSIPQGSIKLKSYSARSLLPVLLSSPASRKREGVVEVLDAFPESRFLLVGDTGEQDMELYAELARKRPNQVLGVFIRDVTTEVGSDSISENKQTTEDTVLPGELGIPFVNREPEPLFMPSRESLASMSSSGSTTSSLNSIRRPRSAPSGETSSSLFDRSPAPSTTFVQRLPGALPRRKSSGIVTPAEKRIYDLHTRIKRAREEIPRHIAFRVFQEPQECVEAEGILRTWLRR